MRQFLIQLFMFGLVAAMGYAGILSLGLVSPEWERTLITRTSDFGGLNRRAEEWESRIAGGAETDIVLLGSSTCYSGIDPAAFEAYGLEGFNLCSSGQDIGLSSLLLDPVLQRGRPSHVVLDMYTSTWSGDWPHSPESARNWVVDGAIGTGPLRGALLPILKWTADPFTALLALYCQVRPRFIRTGERAVPDAAGEYVGKGFFKRTHAPLEGPPKQRECMEPDPNQLRAVREMADRCAAAGVQFLLVHPPVLGCEAVQLPAEFEGIPAVDGNAWPGKSDFRHYYDDHHLVETGAASYSEWLAAQIAALIS